MTEHLLFYQSLHRLNRHWLSTSLFFADKITAVEPLQQSEVVFDRTISRFKLLSSSRLGVYNKELLNQKTLEGKRFFYFLLEAISQQLHLRELASETDSTDDRFLADAFEQGLIERLPLTIENEQVKMLLREVKGTIKHFPGVKSVPPPETSYASLLQGHCLRESIEDLIQCFPGELGDEMYIPLDYNPAGKTTKFWEANDWVRLDKSFLDFFFNSIIVGLAESQQLPVVSDTERYFDLSNQIRFRQPSEEKLLHAGSLFHVTLDSLPSPQDISVASIVKFKKDYATELQTFRGKFEDFTKLLQTNDKHTESLKKEIQRVYKKEIQLSIDVLEKALKGMRVKYTKSFATRLAVVSGSAPLLLSQAFTQYGVDKVPPYLTFLVGAGLLIAQSVDEYKFAKNADVSKSPVNYLYRVKDHLS